MRLLGSWRQLFKWTRLDKGKAGTKEVLESPELPNGFLFNEKPLLPGEKRVKEWWENIYVYGMSFNFLLGLGIVLFKPDTSVSSWAREKALERIAAEEEADHLNQLNEEST